LIGYYKKTYKFQTVIKIFELENQHGFHTDAQTFIRVRYFNKGLQQYWLLARLFIKKKPESQTSIKKRVCHLSAGRITIYLEEHYQKKKNSLFRVRDTISSEHVV